MAPARLEAWPLIWRHSLKVRWQLGVLLFQQAPLILIRVGVNRQAVCEFVGYAGKQAT